MGMAIIESGYGNRITAVDNRVKTRVVQRPDVRDEIAFDGNVRTLSIQFNLFDENAHKPAPFNSLEIKPPSSTACQ